jgi:hypothetical protein
MLMEEAARMLWRYSVPGEAEFKARAKQYFDEYRARRKKTIDMLAGSGVARADAERIFELPSNVQVVTPHGDIAKGREALPSISSSLRAMGEPFEEPGWLSVAYSLLSQITHSTPSGTCTRCGSAMASGTAANSPPRCSLLSFPRFPGRVGCGDHAAAVGGVWCILS